MKAIFAEGIRRIRQAPLASTLAHITFTPNMGLSLWPPCRSLDCLRCYGAPDLIAEGVVPVGDVGSLREEMQRFVDSPKDLARMAPAAHTCAEQHSWDAYGNRWMDLLHQVA